MNTNFQDDTNRNMKSQKAGVPDEEVQASFKRYVVPTHRNRSLQVPARSAVQQKEASRITYGKKIAPATTSGPNKSSRWNVKKGKNIPTHYDLENPVQIDDTAENVAKRIADCLRDRSINATFDDKKAEAVCRTFCQTMYVIRLFICEDPGSTVIEIQRRKGCSLAFRLERKYLIFAAKGEAPPNDKRPNLDIPDFLAKKIPVPSDEQIRNTIDGISKEISNPSRGRDCQLLQIQLLASMTDKKKSNVSTCLKVANIILEGGDNNQLRAMCLNLVDSGNADDLAAMIKLYSLLIFSNCMQCLEDSSDLSDVMEEDDWFIERLYPVLRDNLKKFECPHAATIISKSLAHLLKNSPVLREREELLEPLKEVLAWGKECHKSLYEEASRALEFESGYALGGC